MGQDKVVRIQRNGFKEIADAIKVRIEVGLFESGRYLPTERELQEEFQASRSTIRRALAMLIEGGWAQNIPSKGVVASNGIRRPYTREIAFIDDTTYVLEVMRKRILEMLVDDDLHLVHLGRSQGYSIEQALAYAMDHEFAGALVWPHKGFPDEYLLSRAGRSMPIVMLDHSCRGASTDMVTFDYFEAARQATDHLARRGCRRIAVTGMLDMLDTTQERFSGYMKGMFDNELQPIANDYLFTFTSGMTRADTRLLEARLREDASIDGLVVLQDHLMPDTVEAALRAGRRPPHDLKLVTIGDDVEVTVDGVGMTAVALDWDAMAQESLALLLRRMEEPSRSLRVSHVPHRLIVRGLCGAPSRLWTEDPEEASGFHGDLPIPKQRYAFRET